jgi:hypothetical protein
MGFEKNVVTESYPAGEMDAWQPLFSRKRPEIICFEMNL